jgi:hypothetical protein
MGATSPPDAVQRALVEIRLKAVFAQPRTPKSQGYWDRLQRGYSWFMKALALDPDDLEGRFIYCWIGFNALYAVDRRDWAQLKLHQRKTICATTSEA